MARDIGSRTRNVTAVLGPTNTGKTHLAIERMVGHKSGIIGLPLRLLAREVYDKVSAKVGAEHVALVTGEEKIKPDNVRYWVATVEAMPLDIDVEFVAIDEVQLAADPDRGHVFTDRILNARGSAETLLLGAQTMQDAIGDLIPGANFISRPRLSKLNYSGQKKITRIPARSAVIAFSASDVYAIAELIRRQRGGTAVVLGALSPRTRNAQVELYQSGDVDFLVATDAIGMGLNLDVDHVAFTSLRKFDGAQHRDLLPAEIGQIAGRAGRHMNDGTFGVTGDCPPLEPDLVEALESHHFASVRTLQWRNRQLDFSSIANLKECLRQPPGEPRLSRARTAEDELALDGVSRDDEIVALAGQPGGVERLWDVCQIPDYRKISHQNHAELVADIYKAITSEAEVIPEDWLSKQVAMSDRVDGDIDTLSTRLAHIRTWTYVANRADWVKDPAHWQAKTREVEDRLSDALHERLTQRFVDERTSALMKGMREKTELSAEISEDGALHVENHSVGHLNGFRFQFDGQADGVHARTLRGAAAQVLSRELAMRVRRVVAAKADAFALDQSGTILWRSEPIGELEAGEDPLRPAVTVLCDEHLPAPDRDRVRQRLETFVTETIEEKLQPLITASTATDVEGMAKGIGFQLRENFGVLRREDVASEIKSLDQASRAQLRKHGVRFGAFNIYFPQLLKPAAAHLMSVLWVLKNNAVENLDRRNLPALPRAGLTSVSADSSVPIAYYRANGYHVCGPRVLRIDILERLADFIRPLVAWRAKSDQPDLAPPAGASGDGGFLATADMMSILGCSAEDLGATLKALGFAPHERTKISQTNAVGEASPGKDFEAPSSAAATANSENVSSDPSAGDEKTDTTPSSPSSIPQTDVANGDTKAQDDAIEIVWRPVRRHRPKPHRFNQQGHVSNHKGGSADKTSKQTAQHKHGKHAHKGGKSHKDKRQDDKKRTFAGSGRKQRGKPSHRSHGPKVHQSKPPQSDTEVADSPFAALSDLKDALEKGGKQGS